MASPETALSPRGRERAAREIVSVSSSPDQSENENDEQGLRLTWNGHSRSDLNALFEAAQSFDRTGDADSAERMFLQAMTGFAYLLSPTHEDASKVVYALATFYAERDRMDEANKIIEDLSRAHLQRWGVENRRIQQHVLHVVELLNSWNRQSDALAFLAHAKELITADLAETVKGKRKGCKRVKKTPKRQALTPSTQMFDIAQAILNEPDSAQVDYGITVARTHVLAGEEAVESLLVAMIDHCEQNTYDLAKQRLQAWTELLKFYQKLNSVNQHLDRFDSAENAFRYVLVGYQWDKEKFTSLEVLEACLELAASFLKCGFSNRAYPMFRQAEQKATAVFGWDEERTIWTLISIGLVYQNAKSWNDARPWFEQALAGAKSAYDDDDGIVKSLERAMDVRHFSYINDEGRPLKTIFGVSGICIRPGRLHLE